MVINRYIIILAFIILVNSTLNGQLDYQNILDNLYQTVGNFQIEKPKLNISDDFGKVASYNPILNEIKLEKAIIEICEGNKDLGAEALAFIIAHELAHTYQHHAKENNFITDFLAFDKTRESSVEIERNADIYGAFTCYLSGYNINQKIPKLLRKIYSKYDFRFNTVGYPNLFERMQAGDIAMNQLDTLSHLFKLSNILSKAEEWEISGQLLSYISTFYHGAEIYNNIGITYLLRALKLGEYNIDKFLYPIEHCNNTRLTKPYKTSGEKFLNPALSIEREILLSNANRYFDEVLRLNSNNRDARINKFIKHMLSFDFELAESYLLEIKQEDVIDFCDFQYLNSLLKLTNIDEEDDKLGIEVLENIKVDNSKYSKHAEVNLNIYNFESNAVITDHLLLENLPKFKFSQLRNLRERAVEINNELKIFYVDLDKLVYLVDFNGKLIQITELESLNTTDDTLIAIGDNSKVLKSLNETYHLLYNH